MLKSPIPKKKYYGVKVTEFKKLNKIYLLFFLRKNNYFIEILKKRSIKRILGIVLKIIIFYFGKSNIFQHLGV